MPLLTDESKIPKDPEMETLYEKVATSFSSLETELTAICNDEIRAMKISARIERLVSAQVEYALAKYRKNAKL